MSYQEANRILTQAIADPEFRHALVHNPAVILDGCDLDPAEYDRLSSLTEGDIFEIIGARAIHLVMPVPVSTRFTVIPADRQTVPPAPDQIALLPDVVFGNGTHPTTRLTLALLEKYQQPGQTVLDLGTGSGILAIAAVRLGAMRVLAIDNSPAAAQAALWNADLNQVTDRMQVVAGSLEAVGREVFDLVAANILPHIHIEMLRSNLQARVRPGGMLLLGGIWPDAASDVHQTATGAGLAFVEGQQMGNWIGLAYRRNEI